MYSTFTPTAASVILKFFETAAQNSLCYPLSYNGVVCFSFSSKCSERFVIVNWILSILLILNELVLINLSKMGDRFNSQIPPQQPNLPQQRMMTSPHHMSPVQQMPMQNQQIPLSNIPPNQQIRMPQSNQMPMQNTGNYSTA